MRPIPNGSRSRRVLLIDAVAWSASYPADSPFRDVSAWYSRWFNDLPEVQLTTLPADADLLSALGGVGGVILSGSPRNAWRDEPINTHLAEFILACRDQAIPFLGVCYGHQLLARALGGVVAPHPEGLELGNTAITLTAAGRASPLFAGLDPTLDVLSSHADAVTALPAGAEVLGSGDFTANQAFHWDHRLFGVQFHPETDPDTLRFIWNPRREAWRPRVRFDLDQALNDLQPTPAAPTVLRNFVTRIAL